MYVGMPETYDEIDMHVENYCSLNKKIARSKHGSKHVKNC